MIGGYGALLRSPPFLAYTLYSSLVFGGLFAYISESPFVFIEMLGYSETAYGWFSLLGVGAFATSSLLAGRLSRRIAIPTAAAAGTATTILGGLIMVALAWSGAFSAATILGPMMVIGCGIGLVFPYATAGAMSAHPHIAGTASALLGFIQMALAAAATLIMGLLRDGTPLPMVYMIAGATLAGALPLSLLRLDRRSTARAMT